MVNNLQKGTSEQKSFDKANVRESPLIIYFMLTTCSTTTIIISVNKRTIFVKNGFLVPSQGFFHFGGEFYFFKCEKIRTAPPGKKSGNEKNLFVPWDKKWVWKESFCSMGQKDFFHSHFFYRGVQFESFHTRESVFNKKILICKIFRLVFQKPVLQSRKGTFWSSGLKTTSLNSILQTKKYPFCFSVLASEKLCSNILQIYTIFSPFKGHKKAGFFPGANFQTNCSSEKNFIPPFLWEVLKIALKH